MTEQVAAEAKTRVRKSVAEQVADIDAKIAKLTERKAVLEGRVRSEALLTNVSVGNDVGFRFGRGDKARDLRGVVTAIREESETEARLYRVVINQGTFDEQAFKVRPDQVTANFTVEGEDAQPVAETVEEAEANDAAVDGSDPLNEA